MCQAPFITIIRFFVVKATAFYFPKRNLRSIVIRCTLD
jgi:hypothetical protein